VLAATAAIGIPAVAKAASSNSSEITQSSCAALQAQWQDHLSQQGLAQWNGDQSKLDSVNQWFRDHIPQDDQCWAAGYGG
jgi:hypothetical protein